MSNSALFFAIAVSLLNVCMNVLLSRAADTSTSLWHAVLTPYFFAAFALGLCSLTMLLSLYLQSIELARGMILMAAVSVILGTAVGVMVFRNKLDWVDAALFGAVLVVLASRWIKSG
jgi:hypothetical protein